MNLRNINVLYRREIRTALRDRTIVTNSILLPILLYPIIMWLVYTGIMFISGQDEVLQSRITLRNLASAHAALKKEFESDKSVVLIDSQDPGADIRSGRLDALVEFGPPKTSPSIPDNFLARVTFDESRDASNRAKIRAGEKISRYRENYLEQQGIKLGLSRGQLQNFWIEGRSISSGRGTSALLVLLPIFFIIMLTVGAMHPAIDSTAGERENSTWETMMTTAASRTDVLIAKYLYVATMAFIAAFLNLFAMIFSLGTILAPMFGGNPSLRIPLESAPSRSSYLSCFSRLPESNSRLASLSYL
jgi:sodium transport system permease protein